MKRYVCSIAALLLLLLLSAQSVSAQHYLGAHGGWGASTARLYPKQDMKMVWGRWSAGVSWLHYGRLKYAGAIGAELVFMQRGYSYRLYEATDTVYKRTVNSIVLPMLWHPHVNLFKNRFQVFLTLGITVSYNFGMYEQERSGEEGMLWTRRPGMSLVRDNRWNYGLVGGLGLMGRLNLWDIFFEARYYFGYADLLKNRNKYKGNPLRSPLDNLTFSVGFYRRLGPRGAPRPPRPRKGEIPSTVVGETDRETIIIQ